ncbi:MAG TPA: DUF2922 domain-containing protein [Candidatus Atribacteria bacterium]|nr:DUF2922 domain-containing protein [Candidatus Atribacteria bacterium]HPT78786.1 DUF2922 domain-containing protein [Candidatus Atribacteria bacterium]
MNSILEMFFKTGSGKTFRLAVDDPKPGLTPAEVEAAMDLIVSRNIFAVEGGLASVDSAQIVTTNVEPVIFA